MHGTIMVFFVLTTAHRKGGFGNYFCRFKIGAPDMAFPRLNMLSFWVTFVGVRCIIAAFVVPGGAPISGWTGYTPLSGLGEITGPGEGWGQTLWIVSISLFCLASLLGALNFIATTIDLRAPGMSLMRMPLTVWGWFVTAISGLLAFGVLLAGGILLLLDRSRARAFHSRRPGGERSTAAAQRWFTFIVAASFLVFRAPRGLHRDSSRYGSCLARALHLCAQHPFTVIARWPTRSAPSASWIHGLGPPHVCQRHEPLFRLRVFGSDNVHRCAFGH